MSVGVEKKKDIVKRLRLSPLGFVTYAAIFVLIFLVCHLAGLREYISVLSGTSTGGETLDQLSITLGSLYLIAYFLFILVVPVILVASVIFAGLNLLVLGNEKHDSMRVMKSPS